MSLECKGFAEVAHFKNFIKLIRYQNIDLENQTIQCRTQPIYRHIMLESQNTQTRKENPNGLDAEQGGLSS